MRKWPRAGQPALTHCDRRALCVLPFRNAGILYHVTRGDVNLTLTVPGEHRHSLVKRGCKILQSYRSDMLYMPHFARGDVKLHRSCQRCGHTCSHVDVTSGHLFQTHSFGSVVLRPPAQRVCTSEVRSTGSIRLALIVVTGHHLYMVVRPRSVSHDNDSKKKKRRSTRGWQKC